MGALTTYLGLKSKKVNQGKITLSQGKQTDLSSAISASSASYKRYLAVEKFTKPSSELSKPEAPQPAINALTTFSAPPAQEDSKREEQVVEELRSKKRQEVEEACRKRDLAVEEMNRVRDSIVEARQAIQALEERKAELEQAIGNTAKELKAKDMIAASLSGVEEKKAQVQAMEEEIKEMEREWVEVEDELKVSLARARRQFEDKKMEVEMKQEKIDFYEDNYSKLVQELKTERAKRESLIAEYKSMGKDTKREEMAQMIEETKVRCKESEKSTQQKLHELKVLNTSIGKLTEEIAYLTKDIAKRNEESIDKKKKDQKSHDKLKMAIDVLSKTHNQTKQYMEKFVDLKVKNKQLQDRILDLKRNKYQEISDKLKRDLGDLQA